MTEPAITIRSRFRRVLQVAPYQTAEAEISVEETFPGELSPDQIVDVAQNQFAIAKAQVFAQLGLKADFDEATGMIMEAMPDTIAVTTPPTAVPVAAATPPASTPGAAPTANPKEAYWQDLAGNPANWKDLRPAKASGQLKPTSPDFKSTTIKDPKNDRFYVGLWLTDCPEGLAIPAAGYAVG